MRRERAQRSIAVASAALLLLAAFAPLGASGASALPVKVDDSPSPSARPAGCPDIASGHLALSTIIATGPARMVACAKAQDATSLTFDAWFPSASCDGCGGVSDTILPLWLSGGAVYYDATTGVVTPGNSGTLGMQVATGPKPDGLSFDASSAWLEAHTLVLRLPPDIGTCVTNGTAARYCSISRYVGLDLRISAHYLDTAATTCTGETMTGGAFPASAAVGYCEQQLVVDSFTVATPYVCPTAPYTVADLLHFTSDRLVACLGSRIIAVTAYVPVPVSAAIGSLWVGTPGWLASPGLPSDAGWGGMIVTGAASADAPAFNVRIPPRFGACRLFADDPASCPFKPFAGKWVRFTGHFSDALSSTCSGTWTSPAPKPAYFTKAYVQQHCREQFVLSSKPTRTTAPKAP